MKLTTTKLMIAVSLIAVAGCTKKPPPQLPPAPVENTSGPVTPPQSGSQGTQGSQTGAAAPGTQADFVASVPADRIFFALDSSDVDAPSQGTLQAQAAWLAKYPATRVTIEGHADERGTREYNLALGERRANATKNALVAMGVSADRITTISYGKERPDALGSDEESWAKNRRAVTLTIQ